MQKKLLIFDADGTIWNSELDIFNTFNHTLKENLGFTLNIEDFNKLAGLSLNEMFENVLPEDKKHLVLEFVKKYRYYYIEEGHFADNTKLFKGVRETLKYFKNQKFLLTIASSKPKRILEKMVELFNLTEFDLIIGTEESSFKHKPDPEAIFYTMEKFNIEKSDSLIIGDTKADILAGINAGIDTIAVSYGFEKVEKLKLLKPNFIVDDFASLKDLIKYRE